MSFVDTNFLIDACVPLVLERNRNTFGVDPGWMVGAFFIGLVIAAIVAALLVKPCLRDWSKKKRQDEEEARYTETVIAHQGALVARKSIIAQKSPGKGSKKRKSLFGKKKSSAGFDDEATPLNPVYAQGMVEVMVQTTSEGGDFEMQSQDLNAVVMLEKELDDQRQTSFLKLLYLLLMKFSGKKNVMAESFPASFIKKVRGEMDEIKRTVERERQDAEEALRLDGKLNKNPQALENEIEKLQPIYNQKLANMLKDHQRKVAEDLNKSSGLSEAEIDGLMEKLMQNMGNLERVLGDEQNRQAMVLEERLARRRQLAEFRRMQQKESKDRTTTDKETYAEALDQLVHDGKLQDKQKDELLKAYEQDLLRINEGQESALLRQQNALADKLRERRDKRMRKLNDKHGKERAAYLHGVDKGVGTADFVQNYSDMLRQQRMEQDETITELDQTEVQEMENARQADMKDTTKETTACETRFLDALENKSQLNQHDVNRMLRLHQQQMDAYDANKQKERKMMAARLQEKLAQRMQKLEDDQQEMASDQQAIREQQDLMVNKVVATNMDLTDEAKQKILREHDQNMHALNNRMQMSRIKQQKALEQKLSQRRSKVSELKKKQEDTQRNVTMKEKEKNKLQKELGAQIAAEEKTLEQDRETAIKNLRQRLALETEQALKQQEQELGALIGRLQVGQARRQAIIQRQEKQIEQLQDKLEKKVTSGDTSLDKNYTDQIIQQHYNQMEDLNSQIQANRDRQEQMLQDKIQAKRLKKEREIETKIDDEIQDEYYSQKQRGAGIATSIFTQSMMDQRQKNAISELEKEMKMEMEKCKDELNRQMEEDLQAELQEQKKQFLAQLAAVSNLSTNEINDVLDSPTKGSGDKSSKKIVKEMKQEIERAKSSLGMDDDRDVGRRPSSKQRKSRGDLDGYDNEGYAPDRPRSGRKSSDSRPRSAGQTNRLSRQSEAFMDEPIYDDDDF